MPTDRLTFLHGFTQTHHHWHECAYLIAERLDKRPVVRLVDMPGHGLSGDDRLTVEQAAGTVVGLCGTGTYIGYSMGGRVALAAACSGAREIERLVLVSSTAGLASPGARSARIAEDEQRAGHIEAIGVDGFVDEWLALPLFAGLPFSESDRAHRRRNTAAGLASSLRLAGTGAQPSYWDALASVSIPVLVLVGDLDDKFVGIARRLVESIPGAEFGAIPGAGHAAHTERPAETAGLIAEWLDRTA